MPIRRLAVCIAFVVATFGLTIVSASATEPSTLQCGVNPTTDVVLTQDLTCASSFTIGSSSSTTPITVDLGGHTLTVTNPDAPCRFGVGGVSCAIFGVGPINLVNGTVRGSVGLAAVRGPDAIFRVTIAPGDLWISGVGGRVIQSAILGGSIRAFSSTFVLKYTSIFNGGVSFSDLDTQMAVDIEFNQMVHSPAAGIGAVLGQGGEFQNDVSGTIHSNAVTDPSGSGISLTGALTNIGTLDVSGNRVVNSGADGIHIQGVASPPTPYLGGPVTLTRNAAFVTVGYGIFAPWVTNMSGTAIVDGGRNHARHNGLSPCVGVVCTF